MKAQIGIKSQHAIYLLLAVILLVYLTIRVIKVPLVHDEGATFFFYIQTGKFWFYRAHWDANNHVLNSLLTWISYRFLGDSTFALRLPNLLSFGVFLFFIWKTGQNHLEGIKKHAFVLAMWLCHIYFEHFGYARGYGISFAFLAAALFYLLEYSRNKSLTNVALLLLTLILAMSANLTLLPLGTTLAAWALILWISEFKTTKLSSALLTAAMFAFIVFVINYFAQFSFELKDRNLLYYGGTDGLIPDTMQSIAMGLFRVDNWWLGMGLLLAMIVAMAPLPILLIRNGIVATIHSAYGIFAGLLLLMLVAIVLMNLLLEVNYPTFRTSLYLLPLFFGALAFWPSFNLKIHPSIVLLIFTVLFVIQTNISYAWYWRWERMSPRLYESTINHLPEQTYPALTGGYHLLGLRWALYGYHGSKKMGHWSRDGYPSLIPDVQVLFPQDVNESWKEFYTEVDRDEFSGFPVYIRKEPCARRLIQEAVYEGDKAVISHEFVDLITLESPLQEAYMAGIKMELEATYPHQEMFIVMSCHDESGNNLGYQAMPIHWHYDDLRQIRAETSIFLVKPEKRAVQLKVYLWNQSKEPYRIKSSKTELFELYPEGLPETQAIKTQ